MPVLDVVVMAHPSRTEHALRIAGQLDARIVWDTADNEWHTAARAWAAINPISDWGIVVQDDAIPISGFRAHAARVLRDAPATAVGLYVGTGRPRTRKVQAAVDKAQANDASWLEANGLLWGPGIAIPTPHLPDLLAWCTHSTEAYDLRIAAYYQHQLHQPVRFTWPSLVDHADLPSLLHPTDMPRHAHHVGVPVLGGPVVPIED